MPTAQCPTPDNRLPERDVKALAAETIGKLRSMPGPPFAALQDRLDGLCDGFCDGDPDTAFAMVRAMQRDGLGAEDIVTQVLTRAARLLGQRWLHDRASFADVTIGVGRMQLALRKLSGGRAPLTGAGRSAPILMVAPPGEDHTFGLLVAADILRRRGACVEVSVQETAADLRRRLHRRRFAAVGIATVQVRGLETVQRTVDIVRGHADRHIPVVLGGALTGTETDLAGRTGADHVQSDPVLGFSKLGLLGPTQSAATPRH